MNRVLAGLILVVALLSLSATPSYGFFTNLFSGSSNCKAGKRKYEKSEIAALKAKEAEFTAEERRLQLYYQFADTLRKRKINPLLTPVPEFRRWAPKHIADVRNAIKAQDSDHVATRLKYLDDMELEFRRVRAEKKYTYYWWLAFNFRLSMVITYVNEPDMMRSRFGEDLRFLERLISSPENWQDGEKFAEFDRRFTGNQGSDIYDQIPSPLAAAKRYPHDIFLPTVIENLGQSSLGTGYSQGTFILRIASQPKLGMYGEFFPDESYLFDIERGLSWEGSVLKNEDNKIIPENYRKFDQELKQRIRNLPLDHRIKVRALYLVLLESPYNTYRSAMSGYNDIDYVIVEMFAVQHIFDAFEKSPWLKSLLPPDVNNHDADEVRAYLASAAEIFEPIFKDILEKLGVKPQN